MEENVIQECLCSLGLAVECPAHPFRKRREPKPKVSRQALKEGECGACVFIKEAQHVDGRHPLYIGDVSRALEIGPVYCAVPRLCDEPLLVRGTVKRLGVDHVDVEVLEGFFTGVKDIWMNEP